jgi:hypothetical protein
VVQFSVNADRPCAAQALPASFTSVRTYEVMDASHWLTRPRGHRAGGSAETSSAGTSTDSGL